MSTIILNRMYAGAYLDENMGHEIINLFKDDYESNYIYINKDGRINKEYNDSVRAVLLVKNVEKGVVEVVAKAEKLQQIYYKKKSSEEEIKYQNEYVKEHQVTYGNVLLSDIFPKSSTEILITFKTDNLRTVKKPLFLIDDESKLCNYENHYFLQEKHCSGQSLKIYYTENETPEDYEVLKNILNNPTIWNEENTEKIDLDEIYAYDSHESFLSVIKKEDDELIISNLFEYIFNKKQDVFKDFVKEILGIHDFKTNYRIFREKKDNIDLLIENEDSIIVIENKIKSDINGKKSKSSGKIESQLSKYFEYVQENYSDKKLYFYIFVPNYKQLNLNSYKYGNEYKIINYSQIYNFYFKNAGRMLNIEYFKDFLNGIYIHTMTSADFEFEKMKKQFIYNIKELKKMKND